MSKLKGSTIIELIDSNTGEKQIITENNMIGPFVDWLFNLQRDYLGDRSEFLHYITPMFKRFFGGLLMMEDTVPETTMMVPPSNNVVGAGGYEYTDIDSVLMGTYNKAESEVGENFVRHVWDFSTSQGNGNISCICLCDETYARRRYFGHEYFTRISPVTSGDERPVNSTSDESQWLYVGGLPTVNTFKRSHMTRVADFGVPCVPHICNIVAPTNVEGYVMATNNLTGVYFTDDLSEQVCIRLVSGSKFSLEKYATKERKVGIFEDNDDVQIALPKGSDETLSVYYNNYTVSTYVEPLFKHKSRGVNLIQSSDIELSSGPYFSKWYDRAQKKLYILSSGSSGTLANGSTIDVHIVDFSKSDDLSEVIITNTKFTNATGVELRVTPERTTWYTMGNYTVDTNYMARTSNFAVVDGYYYFCGMDCFFKVSVTNNTDITVISSAATEGVTPASHNMFIADMQGFLYGCVRGSGGANEFVLNTIKNTLKFTDTGKRVFAEASFRVGYSSNSYRYTPSTLAIPMPTKSYSPLVMSCYIAPTYRVWESANAIATVYPAVPFVHKSYLSTINNLQKPVFKTADKTMKITYVLTQE